MSAEMNAGLSFWRWSGRFVIIQRLSVLTTS
jgi:hypothetical protein